MRKAFAWTLSSLALLIIGLLLWWWLSASEVDNKSATATTPGTTTQHRQQDPDAIARDSHTTATTTDKTANHRIQGILIDGTESVIPQGDILYQLAALTSPQCRDGAELDLHLNEQTILIQSNDQGEFMIPLPKSIDASRYCLLLHAGKASYHSTVVNLDLSQHNGLIELELAPHRQLKGQVLLPHGGSTPDATVQSWVAASGERQGEPIPPCVNSNNEKKTTHTVNRDGEFSIAIAANKRYCLQASHPDWASSNTLLVTESWQPEQSATLTLNTGYRLSGQVADSRGQAVSGLALALLPTDNTGDNEGQPVTTNSNGGFDFHSLEARAYQLVSVDPGYSVDRPKTISLQEGEDIIDLQVLVSPVTLVSGRIIDAEGNPLPGVTVQAYSPYAAQLSTVSRQTDESGYFVVPSQHRSKNINDMMVMASGFSETGEQVTDQVDFIPRLCVRFNHPEWQLDTIATTATEPELDLGLLQMQTANLRFSGQVKNHRGEPLSALLHFTLQAPRSRLATDLPTQCHDDNFTVQSQANEQGEFAVSLAQTGTYQVDVITDKYQPRRLTMELSTPGQEIVIQLD